MKAGNDFCDHKGTVAMGSRRKAFLVFLLEISSQLNIVVMGCIFAIQQPRKYCPWYKGYKSLFKQDMEKGNVEAEKVTEGNGNDGLNAVPPPKLLM